MKLWCRLLGHKFGEPTEWTDMEGGWPNGYQRRSVICPRRGASLYEQVRDAFHRLVYY